MPQPRTAPHSRRRLSLRLFGHGFVDGVRFPVLVFSVWRCAHALVVLLFGGSLRTTTHAFDAGYYLQILRTGYFVPPGGYDEFSNVAFFPGLAWTTELVLLAVRSEAVATTTVPNAIALACFVAVWATARAWTDEAVARRTVVALALVPTSYHLWMYYSEGLLVTATAGAAWAATTRHPTAAAPLLVLAGTARVLGLLAGPVLAIARVWRLRRVDSVSVLYVLSSAAGFGAVLLTQAVQIGDPWGWSRAQEAWGRELAPPWVPLAEGVSVVIETLPSVAEGTLLDLLTVVLVGVALAVLVVRACTHRLPVEPAGLVAVAWIVPLCSRLISSQVRFALAAWPALLAVALSWPRVPPRLRTGIVLTAIALTVVLLRRLAQGSFTA